MSDNAYGPSDAAVEALRERIDYKGPKMLARPKAMLAVAHDPALPVRDRSVNLGWVMEVLREVSRSFPEHTLVQPWAVTDRIAEVLRDAR